MSQPGNPYTTSPSAQMPKIEALEGSCKDSSLLTEERSCVEPQVSPAIENKKVDSTSNKAHGKQDTQIKAIDTSTTKRELQITPYPTLPADAEHIPKMNSTLSSSQIKSQQESSIEEVSEADTIEPDPINPVTGKPYHFTCINYPLMNEAEEAYYMKIEREGWVLRPPPPPPGATFPFVLPPQRIEWPVIRVEDPRRRQESFDEWRTRQRWGGSPVSENDSGDWHEGRSHRAEWDERRGYDSEGGEVDEDADDEWEEEDGGDYLPDRPLTVEGRPAMWDAYNDYYVWSCRGNVTEVTEQVQTAYRFEPPISETFVGIRLNGELAQDHLTFLQSHLPGETGTIRRATDRVNMFVGGLVDPEVYEGIQAGDFTTLEEESPDYPPPPMPAEAPSGWERADDATLQTYLGSSPRLFNSEALGRYGGDISLEFLGIRMAQSTHLGIPLAEVALAMAEREHRWDVQNYSGPVDEHVDSWQGETTW